MCVQMVLVCKGESECVRVYVLYLRVSQSLVVDLIQDDHSIGSHRFLPRDVYCTFCHHAIDWTCNVISFV